MQFQKFHQHQIEVNPLRCRDLRSVQPAFRHLIDFITVQHQVGCKSIMLVKKDVLILNGQKLVQGMQVHEQLMLQIMSERITAHHLLCLFVQLAIDKDTLKAELAELKEQLSAFEDAGGWAHKFLKLIERYAAFTDLTPAILNEFISRIEVHERDKKRAKQAVQHIGIYFSYIGKFENELTQLAEPTEEEIRQMREKIEEAQKEKSRAYHRNYSKEYRAKNLEKRREYERIKAREYRAKRKAQAAALPVS